MRTYPILALVAILCGCSLNRIESIELAPGETPAPDTNLQFIITGSGSCRELKIDWGDGFVESWTNVDLAARPRPRHAFSGWLGGKTVTVEEVSGCVGKARTRFTIDPPAFTFTMTRGPGPTGNNSTCMFLGSPLAPMSLVKITSAVPPVVDFGCPVGGCIYGADGKPGSTASAPFPFPGFREFSLVLRVGSQLFQGGTNSQNTVTNAGMLELCQNDNNPSDNTGSWVIVLRVDQLGR